MNSPLISDAPKSSQQESSPPRNTPVRRSTWASGCLILLFMPIFYFFIMPDDWASAFSKSACLSDGTRPLNDKDAVWDIHMLSPNEGWAAGGDSVYYYHNGDWAALDSNLFYEFGLYFTSPREGWAAGDTKSFLHFKDGCWRRISWQRIDFPLSIGPYFKDVFMLSPDEGWAVGDDIMHYSWGRWREQEYHDFNSIYMTSADEGWAVGDYGLMAQYNKGEWQLITSVTSSTLNSLFMVAPGEGWAVGNGSILHLTSYKWHEIGNAANHHLQSVYMVSSSEGWAVANDGAILHYEGGKWLLQANVGTVLRSVYMLSANEGWAGGNGLFHYQDGVWTEYKPKDRQ